MFVAGEPKQYTFNNVFTFSNFKMCQSFPPQTPCLPVILM